ncbi:DNA-binding transcriptional ArsR family regulator [Caulobacter ginsengisoli]|uniref:DNA-binding transcriptional ArsR family regulator n=1 Tax=Caulobacter ginsengisoli TaxID=400775 RepID=A0ABU0IRS3_9CAUL|nr:metalloregulator ArsR/SmtB family transcription factor [Caulobacter ginsengisoli]MDQ0464709.1 DNA-binding transcriptional ArsR family regulator [Caulobacter ginsengisoli]
MEAAPNPDAYDLLFAALAHPARRRILISLNFAGGTMSAGQIAELFGHAWPTTTRHLQAMEAAGLLRHERVGRTRLYHLDTSKLALGRGWLDWFERDPVHGGPRRSNDLERENHDPGAVSIEHRGRRS